MALILVASLMTLDESLHAKLWARGETDLIKTLLWDFGDTLVDETWMQMPMPGCGAWPKAYRDLVYNGSLGDEWSLGNVDTATVAQALADCLGTTTQDAVRSHMERASRNITIFEEVLAYAKSSPLPQAIVTVNPDMFSAVTVGRYELAEVFPVIVTSWEENTLSKAALCDIALTRQGLGIQRPEALLLDNKQDNIEEWTDAGGVGYLFESEQEFMRNPPRV